MNYKKLLFSIFILSLSGPAFSNPLRENCVAAPELPISDTNVVNVDNVRSLYRAVNNAAENTTIVVRPGTYRLTAPISITTDNLTVRGLDTRCDQVVLIGQGMDNQNHKGVRFGFWVNAKNTTIANLTIAEVYNHPIQINGDAESPRIYNVRMLNAGQQFVKSNPQPSGQGVNFGVVEYSVMAYTDGPPKTNHEGSGTGYTNGVDVHGGRAWRIRNNRFINFHTPDGSDHLWNAAILMWRGASDTVAEKNLFVNVDRAIAYGLGDRGGDHRGGVIRNNLIVMTPGLYSVTRRWAADAAILVWDSPGTLVLHNTIVTNRNTPFAIESRFNNAGVVIKNNLTDAPIVHSPNKIAREACKFTRLCRDYTLAFAKDNELEAEAAWFVDLKNGDLRLHEKALPFIRPVRLNQNAPLDYNDRQRKAKITPGAFQTDLPR